MAKKIRNERDIKRAMRKGGWTIRNGRGSHFVGTSPDGKHRITAYNVHGRDEYPKGMRCKLEKALAAAGLVAALMVILCAVVS